MIGLLVVTGVFKMIF
ncbi:small membrane protein YohP [Escherichia coli]